MPEQLERYEQKPLSEQTKQNLMDQLTLADHLVYKKYLPDLQNYALVDPMENLTIEPVPVVLGRQELVQVQAQGAGTILIDKALAGSVTCAVELDESVTAPVLKGQQLGTLRVEAGGRLLREIALAAAQEQLGTLNWENTVVLNYDGILPNAAFFTDLPSELEAFNEFAKAVQDMPFPEKQLPKLKALLEQFEVQDIETAMGLTECLDDYVLTPEISSPQETAIDQLHFMTDDHSVELLLSHVNLYAYGCDLIREDNAVLSPYGLLHRADYQPMLEPIQQSHESEMTM